MSVGSAAASLSLARPEESWFKLWMRRVFAGYWRLNNGPWLSGKPAVLRI
jgi:hypothetical protein